MRVAVTGCAGLIGSHLVDALIARGDRVVGVDNFLTGQSANLDHLADRDDFVMVESDVSDPAAWEQVGRVDAVVQLASPASPVDFVPMAAAILYAGSIGTLNGVQHALRHGARYLHASSSEVYGEPLQHPQTESYRGHVSTSGPRACYDESKRFAEAVVTSYARSYGLDGAIARLFNTYGPRMRVDDGRVVSNFVVQALRGQPLTVYGDGTQTRCFCYVDDQVDGLIALLDSREPGPINIGNPAEVAVLELAETVLDLTGSDATVVFHALPADDPTRRRPAIDAAIERLGWTPTVDLRTGLMHTIGYFASQVVSATVGATGPET